jgi:hypothetical protein
LSRPALARRYGSENRAEAQDCHRDAAASAPERGRPFGSSKNSALPTSHFRKRRVTFERWNCVRVAPKVGIQRTAQRDLREGEGRSDDGHTRSLASRRLPSGGTPRRRCLGDRSRARAMTCGSAPGATVPSTGGDTGVETTARTRNAQLPRAVPPSTKGFDGVRSYIGDVSCREQARIPRRLGDRTALRPQEMTRPVVAAN